MREWTFADLRVAAPDGVETFLAADVVWCGNWATMPNMSAALAEVASLDVDGGTFLLDPGPIVGVSDSRLRRLVDAVAALGDAYSAILSINDDESTRLSAVADGELDRSKRLRELHDRTGAAVVEHGLDAALAATDEGVVRVPNLAVESVVSDTGGGDRFGAGLALARDAGWEWPLALGLGNACASYYVETGETGSASDLAAHLTDGELVG